MTTRTCAAQTVTVD